MQVDARERGFSYSYDAPLDMRMDPEPGARRPRDRERAGTSAAWPRSSARYGEERQRARDRARDRPPPRRAPIETTGELVEAIEAAAPGAVRRAFGGGHPAKRVFQAIRIAVNDELEPSSTARCPPPGSLLRPGGRLAAISFHSLEDRRVKRFLADRARGCICPPDFPVCACGREPEAELLTGRAVAPTPGEVADNPRARSGRLRAARKLTAEEA